MYLGAGTDSGALDVMGAIVLSVYHSFQGVVGFICPFQGYFLFCNLVPKNGSATDVVNNFVRTNSRVIAFAFSDLSFSVIQKTSGYMD
jgi:hypothetical protein